MRLGIDEAGRGCVLGALYVGAFLAPVADEDSLRAAGITDSKKLSAKRRVALRTALTDRGTCDLVAITPEQIDGGNLNALEEAAIVALIKKHRPDEVVIDALGHPKTLPTVQKRLLAALAPLAPRLIMEPKADLTYPHCGAASIVAKTARDGALAEAQAHHDPFGSGYPSDPVTRRWLTAWMHTGAPWPKLVRTRWGTIRDLEAQRKASDARQP